MTRAQYRLEESAESARLSVLAAITLDGMRKRAGLSRSQLANRLRVPPSQVTKVLDGTANITLRTLARFSVACGYHIDIRPMRLKS